MREELLRIVAGLQSARDRMQRVLPPLVGEGCDGDFDVMLEAINALKKQAALAKKAGAEPVAKITGIDEYGPMLEWSKHWVNVGVGAKLYAAAPASQPVALPPGWVAVPREPTLEMLLAEDAAIPSRDEDDDAFAWGRVGWAAMLAAAPKPEEIADFRCADGRKSGCQCIPEIGCNSASAPEVPRG